MSTLLTPSRPTPAVVAPTARWGQTLGQLYPVLVILGALAWASGTILQRRTTQEPAGVKVIHIAHYQLEAGVREGFDRMAARYQTLHPDVRIVQDWVPFSGYGQWLSTQLVSGKPSDIVQGGSGLPAPIQLSYAARYYVPLTEYVRRPNPYNAGTELAETPWLKTYFDEMKISRVAELQQYLSVPLTQFGVRVLYNRPLLKALTGLDTPPADYPGFLAACDRIKARADAAGRLYVPIVGSNTHFRHWTGNVADPLTFPLVRAVDFNHDGYADTREVFAAAKYSLLNLESPALAARFQVIRDIADRCQPGFAGINRDEAVFLFIQQRAVFMSAGSWEALGLAAQAKAAGFEVGVADFPHPSDADPGFAGLAPLPPMEVPLSNFFFHVTRASRHPEAAIDFLQFLSSRQVNEEFNGLIGWIPCILGTRPNPELAAFAPHLRGIGGIGDAQWYLGGDTMVHWQQLAGLFYVNQISYPDLIRDYAAYYDNRGENDFRNSLRDDRRGPARRPARQREPAAARPRRHDPRDHRAALDRLHQCGVRPPLQRSLHRAARRLRRTRLSGRADTARSLLA